MTDEQLIYYIALSLMPGIGPRTANTLLQHFGDARQIMEASFQELTGVSGMGEIRAKAFKNKQVMADAEKELRFVEQHKINALTINDSAYPQRLKMCADAPPVLFTKGNMNLNASKIISVVGTRNNSDYGLRLTEELVEGLKNTEGVLIVSGLAYGIDAIAHKKSLQTGVATVGVLAHGLDRIYPPEHNTLAKDMLANGGLITEFPSGTNPDKTNFPVRNRVVAGISDVTVLVESNLKGGAIITALLAAGYNREVAAFPGRVSDIRSAGCNDLIRKNIASLITNAGDLLSLMNWQPGEKPKAIQPKLFLSFSPEEQKLVDILQDKEQIHADELMSETGMSGSRLAVILLQLEMQGVVRSLPGKFYCMN